MLLCSFASMDAVWQMPLIPPKETIAMADRYLISAGHSVPETV